MRLTFWTDETTNEMRRLWAEGLSGEQIAARIGAASRNAVIGKLHRLGLSGDRQPNREPRNRPPRSFKSADKPQAPRRRRASSVINLTGEPLPPPAVTDIARVSMDDLTSKQCKWPCAEFVSMETPMYCGCSVVAGLPYCEDHARRAFVPSAPAQRGGFVQQKGRLLRHLTSPTVDPRIFEDA